MHDVLPLCKPALYLDRCTVSAVTVDKSVLFYTNDQKMSNFL
ncbi:hypothetical protein CZ787_17970 [Halomonas citrativorans]|uniref:Uncharacterized protein n=1 Tax=Halomonas citrativorans TaxID=2742612 RepID=A0A1R4I528_9GAMM|nr:hypothetical protein CZ787_17970 [Halomonas citrativorans]